MMKVSTVFKNAPSTQAVRIPKEYRLATKEVWVEKVDDNCLMIRVKLPSWEDFFNEIPSVSDDFSMEHSQRESQMREGFE